MIINSPTNIMAAFCMHVLIPIGALPGDANDTGNMATKAVTMMIVQPSARETQVKQFAQKSERMLAKSGVFVSASVAGSDSALRCGKTALCFFPLHLRTKNSRVSRKSCSGVLPAGGSGGARDATRGK